MQKRCAHNSFTLPITPSLHIHISSDFDSGNLQSARVISVSSPSPHSMATVKLELTPAGQPFNPQYSVKQSIKSYFHFSVRASEPVIVQFSVRRMGILGIIEGSFEDYYRVCVGSKKVGQQLPEYSKQKPQDLKLLKTNEQYILEFTYKLTQQKLYFAYHFPYSYQKMCHFLQDMDENFKHSQQHNEDQGLLGGVRGIGVGEHNSHVYYRNQLLIQSLEGRQVNLVTVTDIPAAFRKNGLINLTREPRISKSLFPYFDIEARPYKFNKPYIMVTSRVHPGETSASYALEGFIKRLLGTSAQAEFLRKTFVFLIVPMINPDGVFHGTYRMDMQGHNLNRFYNNCAAHKQPAIFAISSLLQHHSEDLVAFFDLHSHPQAKGSFAYGNAYNSIEDQTESQVFAKLLSINSQSFNYQNCTFSQKNMNSKDINDILTKDGSSRVCAYKKMLGASLCGGVHCYAIQLGYHGCPIKKDVSKAEEIAEFKGPYRRATREFDLLDYYELGADLANTICQVYIQTLRNFGTGDGNGQNNDSSQDINTTNNSAAGTLVNVREQVAKQIYEKDERFRIMDLGLLKKIKTINSLICTNLYTRLVRKYPSIIQNIKDYDQKKIKKQVIVQAKHTGQEISLGKLERNGRDDRNSSVNGKVVHSLELVKNSYSENQNKKVSYNNQILQDDLRKLKQKFPPRDIKNIIIRSSKQKVNIIPLEFHISNPRNSSQTRNIKKRDANFNRILQMQADSLPRIEKKKFNFLTERHKLRQKRIQSSINTNNHNNNNMQTPVDSLCLPVSRGGLQRKMFRGPTNINTNTGTIDSNNIDDIIEYENLINYDPEYEQEQEQERPFNQAAEEYNSNYNPETNAQMHMVRNQAMFRRQGTIHNRDHNANAHHNNNRRQINHYTERIHRRLETFEQKKRSKSRQKLVISAHNQNNNNNQNLGLNGKALPKLSITEKVRNKFDLELKMKQKYDKQYKLDDRMKMEIREKLQSNK